MQIEQLLALSVKENASDLHILPGTKPLLRVDGVLAVAKETTALTPDIMEIQTNFQELLILSSSLIPYRKPPELKSNADQDDIMVTTLNEQGG